MRVILQPYDPGWVKAFHDQKLAIMEVVGSYLIHPDQDIQHIGSTAVPGLMAKGTIDMLIGLREVGCMDTCVGLVSSPPLSYQRFHAGETSTKRRYLFRQNGTSWSHALHLIDREDPLWDRFIRFRNALRQNNELRDVYGRLKLIYADQFGHDAAAYTQAKDAFILAVLGGKSGLSPAIGQP